MIRRPGAFFELARRAIGTTQAGLGAQLGVSRRTAQRWTASTVPPHYWQALACLVHPHHPSLAREIAAAAGTTLEQLGLEKPPAPPPPPAPAPVPPPAKLPEPPRPPATALVDAVVCAAAEAMSMIPRDVRLGLHAAFARAQVMGLTIEEVEGVLRPKPPAARATQRRSSPRAPRT